jgi:2-polyprenyl-3-methyl-5-hydroxy-6-metoxy-1,4-benzoquinol methylase
MNKELKEILNKAYENAETVPWNNIIPPSELVGLIETGMIKPCKTLDIGCGNGHYSIFLAKNGFKVTGIDISHNAIIHAKENAQKEKLIVHFRELDARDISQLDDCFDFVFEWGLLHFIFPEFREKYIHDLALKINQGGMYLVLTFNEKSPEWGGGKSRTGLSGAPLYYSSMEELLTLYKPYFEILETKIRPTLFKNSGNEHLENYLLLERK